MTHIKNFVRRQRRGIALLISMIFILVFSALAVSLAAMSGTNVQIADNQRKINGARASAESGHEIIRFWLNNVSIQGNTAPAQLITEIANSIQADLTANGISNITTTCDGSTITIPTVALDSTEGQSFSATIRQLDGETLQADITGIYGTITRTVRVNYKFSTTANTVFDFGVATKGALHLAGNIELTGINLAVEASVYIESENSAVALSIIGNSQIAGDVSITNPLSTVDLQGGKAGIGGEKGDDAINNHVTFGAPPTEFPTPDPGYFEHYAVNIVDSTTDTTSDMSLENVKIVAGTNPNFSGNVSLKGIVFIETPNVVTFTGNSSITGIVVGDGLITDNSATNQITFLGNVESAPVTELPDEPQFADIKSETGTFVIAPGFAVSFGGGFDTLNGAIAANGIQFFGNAGGTINGSVLNYSDEEMNLSGNSDLYFNRSGLTELPTGFVPNTILQYDPASYSEVAL